MGIILRKLCKFIALFLLELLLSMFCSSSNAGYLELLVSVENNEDLGEKLIQAGYAVLKTTSSVPGENELFLVD